MCGIFSRKIGVELVTPLLKLCIPHSKPRYCSRFAFAQTNPAVAVVSLRADKPRYCPETPRKTPSRNGNQPRYSDMLLFLHIIMKLLFQKKSSSINIPNEYIKLSAKKMQRMMCCKSRRLRLLNFIVSTGKEFLILWGHSYYFLLPFLLC